jgi:arabinofuranosyltransferase
MQAKHASAIAVLGAGLAFVVESWVPRAHLDDAYISYRYARNLIQGAGLVYNPGDRVEGFSNLLWTLLIAAGMALGFDAPAVAHWLGLMSGVAVLVLTWALASGFQGSPAWPAAVAPWIVLASPSFVIWSTCGMETPLFAAAATAALLAEQRGRLRTAAAMAIVATLTRPDGPLLALCLFGARLLTRPLEPRIWGRGLVAYIGAVIALTTFRLWYYGDVLPNTFYAKVGGIPLSRGVLDLWDFLLAGGFPLIVAAAEALRRDRAVRTTALYVLVTIGYVVWVGGDVFPHSRFFVAVLPALVAVAARGAGLARTAPPLRGAATLAGFAAAGPWFALGWLPGVILALGVMAGWLARSRPALLPAMRWRVAAGLAIGALALWRVGSSGSPKALLASIPRVRMVRDFAGGNAFVHALTERTGRLLRQQDPPIHLVAAGGIGVIGWESGLPIVDYLGLVDRSVARSRKAAAEDALLLPGHQRSDADYVFARKPDFIVIGRTVVEGATNLPATTAILEHPDLARYYVWQDGPLEGFRRRPE